MSSRNSLFRCFFNLYYQNRVTEIIKWNIYYYIIVFASFLGPPRRIQPGNSPPIHVPRVLPQTLGF